MVPEPCGYCARTYPGTTSCNEILQECENHVQPIPQTGFMASLQHDRDLDYEVFADSPGYLSTANLPDQRQRTGTLELGEDVALSDIASTTPKRGRPHKDTSQASARPSRRSQRIQQRNKAGTDEDANTDGGLLVTDNDADPPYDSPWKGGKRGRLQREALQNQQALYLAAQVQPMRGHPEGLPLSNEFWQKLAQSDTAVQIGASQATSSLIGGPQDPSKRGPILQNDASQVPDSQKQDQWLRNQGMAAQDPLVPQPSLTRSQRYRESKKQKKQLAQASGPPTVGSAFQSTPQATAPSDSQIQSMQPPQGPQGSTSQMRRAATSPDQPADQPVPPAQLLGYAPIQQYSTYQSDFAGILSEQGNEPTESLQNPPSRRTGLRRRGEENRLETYRGYESDTFDSFGQFDNDTGDHTTRKGTKTPQKKGRGGPSPRASRGAISKSTERSSSNLGSQRPKRSRAPAAGRDESTSEDVLVTAMRQNSLKDESALSLDSPSNSGATSSKDSANTRSTRNSSKKKKKSKDTAAGLPY